MKKCHLCETEATYRIVIERVAINVCIEHAVNLILSRKVLRRTDDSTAPSIQTDLDACAQLILDSLESNTDHGVNILVGLGIGTLTEATIKGGKLDETLFTKAIEAHKKFEANKTNKVHKDIPNKT